MSAALLYSAPLAIVGIELEHPHANFMPVQSSAAMGNVSALDVLAATGALYWTDGDARAILRAHMNASGLRTLIDSGQPAQRIAA